MLSYRSRCVSRVKGSQGWRSNSILLLICSSVCRPDLQTLMVSSAISWRKMKAEAKLISRSTCWVTQPLACCCCFRLTGVQHSDPPGFLTHSHAEVESTSHHSEQITTACFHGFGSNAAVKEKTLLSVPACLRPSGGSPPRWTIGEQTERASRKQWSCNIIAGPVIWFSS